MIVIGGYNSSNTNHLAVMASRYCKTFHIDDPACMLNGEQIRHKRIESDEILTTSGWLSEGKLKIGMTAGASTPNNKIGEAIEKILSFRGVEIDQILRR